MAQIGVKMNIEQLEETTAQELYNTERFTVRISAWTNDTPDPDELMGVALDYEPQNGLHSSYRSDEARDLVLEARRTLDQEKRQELYSELQRIVNRDCPFLYTVEEDRLYGSTRRRPGLRAQLAGQVQLRERLAEAVATRHRGRGRSSSARGLVGMRGRAERLGGQVMAVADPRAWVKNVERLYRAYDADGVSALYTDDATTHSAAA